MRISVDVGGTFTDVIVLDEDSGDLRLEKVETTPIDPAQGVLQGFEKAEAELDKIGYFMHGTTLAINALLTRSGASVAIVTTKGFRDVYELGRTSRDPMYDFKYRKPKTLVPRHLVFEIEERMNFKGEVLRPFDEEVATQVARRLREQAVESVAVCLLHSYANPEHELAMEAVLKREAPEVSITLSHWISREYREYERTSTTVIDAYVKPITRSYIEKLDGSLRESGFNGHFLLTRSGGGAMTVESAEQQPVHLVLSGPAGGVIGAKHFSELIGYKNLLTMDMGGTSLDCSLIADGGFRIQTEQSFRTLPISIPTLDIKTIGAGGGSIAWIDDAEHLQVGPESAGAVPGPACYDKGGEDATFTDAALLVGYLDPKNFLGGDLDLDQGLALKAIERLTRRLDMSPDEVASGVLRISEAKIAGAVREISIERGYHPKDFALFAFGGAGGFVAARVAREIGIPRVIVPPGPAFFSALGMLTVDVVHDFAQTFVHGLEDVDLTIINGIFSRLLSSAREALEGDGFATDQRVFLHSAELRYQGQEHTVNVPVAAQDWDKKGMVKIVDDFNESHERHYGHRMEDPAEVVTLRVRAIGRLPKPQIPRIDTGNGTAEKARKGKRSVYLFDLGKAVKYPVYDQGLLLAGHAVEGPAIVEEPSSTIVLHEGDVLSVGEYGESVIEIGG